MTPDAAQEPFGQENWQPLVNDSFRVSGPEKRRNWTRDGNDRFGELDGNFWLTMSDRLRCLAAVSARVDSRRNALMSFA
jgi:hypothetical protein